MHELVKEFLDKKRAEQKDEILKQEKKEKELKEIEKRDYLYSIGLYEKVYSPNGTYSDEYCYYEEHGDIAKYYKREPIPITDEEFEEIKALCDKKPNNVKSRHLNPISVALTVIACLIYIGGFIAGLAIGEDPEYIFAIWAVTGISGTMMLSFAEIIKLLHNINKK